MLIVELKIYSDHNHTTIQHIFHYFLYINPIHIFSNVYLLYTHSNDNIAIILRSRGVQTNKHYNNIHGV